jgi:acetyl-CoA C-acetyltransferase
VDDRTPVVVGVAQTVRHPDPADPDAVRRSPQPAVSTAEVIAAAETDSGGHGLLRRASALWVVDPVGWRYRDPVGPVATELGIDPSHRLRSGVGGEVPSVMLNRAAEAVAAGRHDIVLIAGTEQLRTRKLATRLGLRVGWPRQGAEVEEPESLHPSAPNPVHPAELAVGLTAPIHYYPLFETALRARYRRTRGEHTAAIGRLWSAFSRISATNPYAWRPGVRTPEEITTVGPANRMVCYPYPKLLNADMGVDQSAALIVCSVAAARAAGVPTDRWVFPWAGASARDHWFVGERADLSRSPAIAANGRAVLAATGLDIEQITHTDLYSCFPSAVQVAADELGLPLDPAPTVTGGLTFAGGPGSNYVAHSAATMVGRLRAEPDGIGLLSGNGWFLTKHALSLLSGRPPARPYRNDDPQPEIDALPRVEVARTYDGPARLETYIVRHDCPTPTAVAAVRLPDGRRAWARGEDPGLVQALQTTELLGTQVTLRAGELTPL